MHQKDSWTNDSERRLALYKELEGKVASGEALELKEVIVGLVSGSELVLLLEEEPLEGLLGFMDGGVAFGLQEAIRFPVWQPYGARLDFKLRLNTLCFVQVSENRWFLSDGKAICFDRGDLAQFKGMEQ